ncbi:KAP family NTPase [Aquincola sp. J276]|uniref:KAP family NTPase n=1 Tax=Aquincola sp. J276 TaxID=2898432 RepID=UPI002150E2E8|nr:KAP family NTPase [Aquincola sp. J276]MCR5868218.1 KAP family NTPase [Aquincola sp. J276]
MQVSSASTPGDWLAEFAPARSLALDQEALRIYEHAYAIGAATEDRSEPPITFSTVALALLHGEDETSRWFARESANLGPDLVKVKAEKHLAPDSPVPNGNAGRPQTIRLSSDKQLLTTSARAVLETAEAWANRVGAADIGVRHILATYVVNPPAAHRRQLIDWGFNEHGWRPAFFAWIAPRYTAESWEDASQRAAPAKPVGSFERTEVRGEALAFPGDEPTMAVLERAARDHARRREPWLRLQTILFALAEQARTEPEVRAGIAPLWQAIEAVHATFFAERAASLVAPEPAAPAPFEALNISPRVLNGLETARELALAGGTAAPRVGVLQLAAALVSRRVDNDADLAKLGLDGPALRRTLIGGAAATGQNADIWRDALGEEDAPPSSRPVDLNSDEPEAVIRTDAPWKTDPLGIRSDVHSFAALLASRSLEPPLSIGLFGPWGSGKTTFLKRLRLVVDQRADDATAQARDGLVSPWVANVVHVEFNAWHFAEDALVSSLIDTVVRELRAFIGDDRAPIGQQLLALRAKTVDGARRAVDEARAREMEARQSVDATAAALSASEAQAQSLERNLRTALAKAWADTVQATKDSKVVRDSGVLDQIGGTVRGVQDLQQRIAAIRTRAAPMLGSLGTPSTLAFAALVLLLPPLTAWAMQQVGFVLSGIEQALSTVVAVLSSIGLWLRAASAAAGRVEKAVAEVALRYEQQVGQDSGVMRAEAALETARAGVARAAHALAAAERALQAAQSDAATASLPAQMLTLAASRVDDATYAKELTTISAARGDLQLLSRILRDQSAGAAPSPAAPSAAPLRPVVRVILYIDDLDRCSSAQVVRVLQVVHMLLAFELFVVVVAVDARWIEASLKAHYRWLDHADEADAANDRAPVTPQDYLEKIFQISFWLEPMTASRAAAFLKSMARPDRPDGEAPIPRVRTGSGTGLEGLGRIDIETLELDYMRALAAYVGPSPRRVKRLVNAYRLLKARMSDAQLAGFITDRNTDGGESRSGPYQLVIGLLVIGTGAPAMGARILTDLARRDPRDGFEQVIEAYRQRGHADWTMAARVLETLMRTQKARDISELRGWAGKVGRFLLQGPREVVGPPAAT